MQVLSPYGKDVLTELKNIYGFDSVESAIEFIISHLQQQYQFQTIEKGVFAWAFLETLGDLSEFKASQKNIDLTQALLHNVLEASAEELLSGV